MVFIDFHVTNQRFNAGLGRNIPHPRSHHDHGGALLQEVGRFLWCWRGRAAQTHVTSGCQWQHTVVRNVTLTRRTEPTRCLAMTKWYLPTYIVDFRGVYCQAGCFVYNLGPPPERCPVPNWVKMKACRNTNEVIWRLAICFCFPTQLAFDMRINMGRKYYYFWLQHAIQFGWIHLFPIVVKTVTEFEWAKLNFAEYI